MGTEQLCRQEEWWCGYTCDGGGGAQEAAGVYDSSPRSFKTFKYTTCGGFSYRPPHRAVSDWPHKGIDCAQGGHIGFDPPVINPGVGLFNTLHRE